MTAEARHVRRHRLCTTVLATERVNCHDGRYALAVAQCVNDSGTVSFIFNQQLCNGGILLAYLLNVLNCLNEAHALVNQLVQVSMVLGQSPQLDSDHVACLSLLECSVDAEASILHVVEADLTSLERLPPSASKQVTLLSRRVTLVQCVPCTLTVTSHDKYLLLTKPVIVVSYALRQVIVSKVRSH